MCSRRFGRPHIRIYKYTHDNVQPCSCLHPCDVILWMTCAADHLVALRWWYATGGVSSYRCSGSWQDPIASSGARRAMSPASNTSPTICSPTGAAKRPDRLAPGEGRRGTVTAMSGDVVKCCHRAAAALSLHCRGVAVLSTHSHGTVCLLMLFHQCWISTRSSSLIVKRERERGRYNP